MGQKGQVKKLAQANEVRSGRSPRATNISSFYDGHNGSRQPGAWPSLLRLAWETHSGQTQPYPHAVDNVESRGSRASQYTS
jgi:hypothetical protein